MAPSTAANTSIEQEPLHAALEALPNDAARDLIIHFFGLFDEEPMTLAEIAGDEVLSLAYKSASTRKWWYLKQIKKYLEQHYPDFVARHASRPELRAQARSHVNLREWMRIPQSTQKRYESAVETLLSSGETIDSLSIKKIRQIAGGKGVYASAFLYRLRAKETYHA